MDWDNLRIFLAIARAGTVSEAARQLELDHSTVSRRLANLETRLSIRLFDRAGAFCNSWNHDRLWPKAFVHVDDAGRARIHGEVITDLECGVTPHQLDRLLDCGITTGCQLAVAVRRLPGAVPS